MALIDIPGMGAPQPNLIQPGSPSALMTPEREDAWLALDRLLNEWGLGELSGLARQLIGEGAGEAKVVDQIRRTPQYQDRYRAKVERERLGLPPISEAQVIEYEGNARRIFQALGVPKSALTKDITDGALINDVDIEEFGKRTQMHFTRLVYADPETQQQYRQLYQQGITPGEIVGMMLNPKNTMPELESKLAAAEIGGAAQRGGFTLGRTTVEGFAKAGIDKGTANRVFGVLAQNRTLLEQLVGETGFTPSIEEASAGLFGLKAEGTQALERKAAGRRAEFEPAVGTQVSQAGLLGLQK